MRLFPLVLVVLLALPGAGDPHAQISARRQLRFAQGQAQGAAWMLECRDMWDAADHDGGVYFHTVTSLEDVKRELRYLMNHPNDVRLLGVYDLKHKLRGQGPGITADEFFRNW